MRTTTGWVADAFDVRLRSGDSPVGLEVADLVRLALRRNPRRAHLLVSTVLGKHLPVPAGLVRSAGRLLGALVGCRLQDRPVPAEWAVAAALDVRGGDGSALDAVLPRPVAADAVVLGFAETATALGHLVAEQLAADVLHSTRRPHAAVPVSAGFQEGHSHATDHLLQPWPVELLLDDRPLVLVDDELSTGRTAMGTIEALHALAPRGHYLLAALVDLRSPDDAAEIDALAARLGVRIDVVSLAAGTVDLAPDLIGTVAQWQDDHPVDPAITLVPDRSRPLPASVTVSWPAGLPDSGRHGLLAGDHAAVSAAVARIAAELRERFPAGVRSVLVVGVEEFMYLPLRLACELARNGLSVGFQSTTRSPVWPLDTEGYPVRRRFVFGPSDPGETGDRYLYNGFAAADVDAVGSAGEADLVLVVTDTGSDPAAVVSGAAAAVSSVTTTLVMQVDSVPVLPEPLHGPEFGSYPASDVSWLLTDLSDADLEGDVAAREALIQSGAAHYAESLPVEYRPDAAYRELFDQVLAESAARLARAVGVVTELVLAERGPDVVLASLARAGTPIGILMRRWARTMHDLDLPHHTLSIVRGRGIDRIALGYLARRYDPRRVVFVDGWTGKGAIARELTAALDLVRAQDGWDFDDDLAVLADPGYCVRTFGTRDDFLIASACLNSTVSGLVSRTVLNPLYLRPDQFHGAKFYSSFAPDDVSRTLIEAVCAEFSAQAPAVATELATVRAGDRSVTFAGWAAVERIREEYGISSVNFVKPGVGETTRVLLRRVPWRILVREPDHPDHAHLRLLAADRGVPIEVRPDLPYSCVGLIRPLSATDRGEG